MRLYRREPIIYAADFAAASLTCGLSGTDADPDLEPFGTREYSQLDLTAARELHASGFADVGAYVQDATPTLTSADQPAHRPDRIYTTLPTTSITGYRVEDGRVLSPHHPVCAQFTIHPKTLQDLQPRGEGSHGDQG
jgi:hypothetical protein